MRNNPDNQTRVIFNELEPRDGLTSLVRSFENLILCHDKPKGYHDSLPDVICFSLDFQGFEEVRWE